MTESLAHHLKIACRTGLFLGTAGLLLIYWMLVTMTDPQDVPFTGEGGLRFVLIMAVCTGSSMLVGLYLSMFLGVDVFGLNRLVGAPRGRPFEGLQPGEQERLRLNWVVGGLGFMVGYGFKVLVTDRRLLVGSSLTSWYLVDIPLDQIERVEQVTRWRRSGILRLHLRAVSSRRFWDILLVDPEHRELLLSSLGQPARPGLDRAGGRR